MGLLSDPVVLSVLLVAAVLFVVWLWLRGDPQVESPRSQMAILEEALRNRGFKPIIPLVRNFERYKEERFLEEIQEMLVPFSQDREFVHDWLGPILMANLPLIFNDPDLLMRFDLAIRKQFGYRLKPIRHIEYGLRPETKLFATRDEADVCFTESEEVSLSRGKKEYVELDEKADQ